MIHLICGEFDIYDEKGLPTGRKEFTVSHGVDDDTGRNVILPIEHPSRLGGVFTKEYGWIIPDPVVYNSKEQVVEWLITAKLSNKPLVFTLNKGSLTPTYTKRIQTLEYLGTDKWGIRGAFVPKVFSDDDAVDFLMHNDVAILDDGDPSRKSF